MQSIMSFTGEEGASKRRKALRACQRCKDSKKRCTLINGSPSCKRCTEDGWACSFQGVELPSPVEPQHNVQSSGEQGDFAVNYQPPETPSNVLVESTTWDPAPTSTLLWSEKSCANKGNARQGQEPPQDQEETHCGSESELRYAKMLSLLDNKESNTSSSKQSTKLIAGTNPLSALLGKELKHKIVINSCSFRTPDPGYGQRRPPIRRDGGLHSCDWEQFYRSVGVSEHRLQYLRALECFKLPTPSRCAELLEIFFSYVHPMMPVIDRGDFLSRYYGGDEPPSLILLHAVFLTASRYGDNSENLPSGVSEVRSHCDEIHGKLKALLEAEITWERTAVVQASLLASLHWEGREGLNSAIDNLSLAVRACQEMGLHRRQQSTAAPPVGKELLHRRLWWCLYALDRFNAAQEGTPFLINELECDVDMLTDKDVAGEDQLTQSATLLSISLARLIEDAVRSLYMPGEDHTTLLSSRGVLTRQRLGLQLEQLARQIMDKLMSGHDLSQEATGHEMSRSLLFGGILLTHLDAVRILVHRPFLLYLEPRGQGVYSSRSACRAHAQDILSRLNILNARHYLRYSWPFTVYAVVNCLLIFWYDISAPETQDSAKLAAARQHYSSVIHLLRIMGTTWWAASAKYRLAQALARAADELHRKKRRDEPTSAGLVSVSNDNLDIQSVQEHLLTPPSGTYSQLHLGAGEWPDGDIFADCNTEDYWASLDLNFDLDVAGNIFSLPDLIPLQ